LIQSIVHQQKVGLFIRSLNKGGAENQSLALMKVLSGKFDVKLIVLFKEGELISKANDEIKKENIIYIHGTTYISKAYYFYRFLTKQKFDYLFCYLPSNNVLGIVIGKLAGLRFIFGGLRGSKIKKNLIKMLLQKYLLNYYSTAIISNSYKAKSAYSSFGINEQKIQVIHNGFEVSREYLYREERKNYVNVLSVGRFVPEKDYKTSLLAIKQVNELISEGIEVSYVIVGYGSEEDKIRNWIDQFGLNNQVKLVVNPSNLDQYFKDADIFLITSTNEGMPNVIMEAMSYSLPVVTTDAGDAAYLVKDGENGFVCSVGDYQLIAKNMLNLISSNVLRNTFGKTGYNYLKSNFSIDKLGIKYESIMNSYK
jgi:glycosyltransferase involved in cell wall biosynthesis